MIGDEAWAEDNHAEAKRLASEGAISFCREKAEAFKTSADYINVDSEEGARGK